MKAALLIIIFTLCSCCQPVSTTKTVTIRDTVLSALPPLISDTLPAVFITDTLIRTEVDTLQMVSYYPQLKKFYVRIQPDTVKIPYKDTVTVIQPRFVKEVEKYPFTAKVGLFFYGVVAAVVAFTVGLFLKDTRL
jgi:hypothetical protein